MLDFDYPSHDAFPSNGPSPSRLKALLLNNAPLNDTEHATLSCITSLTPDLLATFDSQIGHLIRQREIIETYAEYARAVLHPVRNLPNEILYEIFVSCVREEYRTGESSLDPRRAPWTLSQVCRQWRSVALSDRHLWSTLQINFSSSSQGALGPAMHRLGLQLDRAGDWELHVELISTNILSTSGQDALLYMTLLSSDKWKSLKVSLFHIEYHYLGGYKFARLQDLDLSFHSSKIPTPGSAPITIFSTAHSLRSVKVYNQSTWWPTDIFAIPWAKITSFTSVFGPYNFMQRLAELPNLQTLYLGCETLIPSTARIDLPRIITLTLHEHRRRPKTLAAVFALLNVPNVRVLHLLYEPRPTKPGNEKTFYIDIPRVPPEYVQLEEVELGCYVENNLRIPTMYDFFCSLHSVRRLNLRVVGLPLNVFDLISITVPGGTECVLPQLKCLDLRGSRVLPTPSMTCVLISMVLARAQAGRRLERLYLERPMLINSQSSYYIARWKEASTGLEVIHGCPLELPFSYILQRRLDAPNDGILRDYMLRVS